MHNVKYEKYEKDESVTAYNKKITELLESMAKEFKELQATVEKDLGPLDKDRLIEEANRNISLYHRYVSRLAELRIRIGKSKTARSEIEAELYDYYRFNWDKSTKLTESAIQKYVYGHRTYLAINSMVITTETYIQYLESVVDAFSQRNWTIKNIIEVRKLELGLT